MAFAKELVKNRSGHSFPKTVSLREIVGASSFLAGTGYIFLVVFQPFGTYTYSDPYKYIRLLPYSIFLFFVFSAVQLIARKATTNWTLSKEIGQIVAAVLVCTIPNYWYNALYINYSDFSLSGFLYMMLYTFLLVIPISTIYLLWKYAYHTKRMLVKLPQDQKPMHSTNESVVVTFQPHSGESVPFSEESIWYVKSEGNYCGIYYFSNGAIRIELLRISLNEIENQTFGTDILRCHRSYLVNTKKIIGMTGNAQGCKLSLDQCESRVPVSRKYIARFKGYRI